MSSLLLRCRLRLPEPGLSLHLPITIIMFNNGSFGWIKMLQRLYYGQRYLGVDFTSNMDAVGIAEAFGIHGVRISHPDQLIPAITDALTSTEPIFIDVPTKSELEEVPPVHAWQEALKRENTFANAEAMNLHTANPSH